ncbi:MAG: helix-turn-helix domain-containing protein, partial [Xanthobacteraceae bacterium]
MQCQEKTDAFRGPECWIPLCGMLSWHSHSRTTAAMPRVEMIRGLARGLRVLQVLQSQSTSSLHDIHLATRIPKPSLLRILNTL